MPPPRRCPRRSRDSRPNPSSVGMREEDKLGQRSKLDEQWNARFTELLSYRSEHGVCDIPIRSGKLGRWIDTQRNNYMAGSLAKGRIDQLNSIGFSCVMARGGIREETGRLDFMSSSNTRQSTVTATFPRRRENSDHGCAGSVRSTRPDRLHKIASIGSTASASGWSSHGVRKDAWKDRFRELARYKAEHGDCDVPVKQGKLGKRADIQRTLLTRRASYHSTALTASMAFSDGIGFNWTPPRGGSRIYPKVPWETRFNELIQYKAKHGDCKVPRSQGPLGRWVRQQREVYKKGKLSQYRIDRLNGIGFDRTEPRGGSRKREALPSTWSSSRQMGLPALISVECDGTKGQRFHSEPLLPLQQIPSSKSNLNLGTESDDEVDEIGALIYDQVMRNKGKSN